MLPVYHNSHHYHHSHGHHHVPRRDTGHTITGGAPFLLRLTAVIIGLLVVVAIALVPLMIKNAPQVSPLTSNLHTSSINNGNAKASVVASGRQQNQISSTRTMASIVPKPDEHNKTGAATTVLWTSPSDAVSRSGSTMRCAACSFDFPSSIRVIGEEFSNLRAKTVKVMDRILGLVAGLYEAKPRAGEKEADKMSLAVVGVNPRWIVPLKGGIFFFDKHFKYYYHNYEIEMRSTGERMSIEKKLKQVAKSFPYLFYHHQTLTAAYSHNQKRLTVYKNDNQLVYDERNCGEYTIKRSSNPYDESLLDKGITPIISGDVTPGSEINGCYIILRHFHSLLDLRPDEELTPA